MDHSLLTWTLLGLAGLAWASSASAADAPKAASTAHKPTKPLKTQRAPAPAAKPAEAAPAVPDQPLSSEEIAIAQRVHLGRLPCELGQSVRMEPDAQQPGYFHLHGQGFRYRLRPVATSSGAIRLEDAKAGAVWLQLANKSMLMDQKQGRRLADECAHPDQVAFAEDMKRNPPPALIDVGPGR